MRHNALLSRLRQWRSAKGIIGNIEKSHAGFLPTIGSFDETFNTFLTLRTTFRIEIDDPQPTDDAEVAESNVIDFNIESIKKFGAETGTFILLKDRFIEHTQAIAAQPALRVCVGGK